MLKLFSIKKFKVFIQTNPINKIQRQKLRMKILRDLKHHRHHETKMKKKKLQENRKTEKKLRFRKLNCNIIQILIDAQPSVTLNQKKK